jgi:hypothetical protein
MEFIQFRKYKYDDYTDTYFLELQFQIECLVEECIRGTISIHETDHLLFNEFCCAGDDLDDLGKKIGYHSSLNNFEDDTEEFINKMKVNRFERANNNIYDYKFIVLKAMQKIAEISKDSDYNKKRIEYIKQQIRKNGLPLIPKLIEKNKSQTLEISMTESENRTILPPVFMDVLTEGLLRDTPINCKYAKRAGKNDKDIIKWIFDYSGYAESLTADLYMQYIHTAIKPQSIGVYISQFRNEAKI